MKLFNVVAMYDFFVVAETSEAARDALLAWIRDGAEPIDPTDIAGTPIMRENAVRKSALDKKPLVGADVSEKDFESIRGKTVGETYTFLYTKEPKK